MDGPGEQPAGDDDALDAQLKQVFWGFNEPMKNLNLILKILVSVCPDLKFRKP